MKNLLSISYLWEVVNACLKNNYIRTCKKVLSVLVEVKNQTLKLETSFL